MAPSDQDLKSQLSDIQKRLSEATFNSPKRSSILKHDENAAGTSNDAAANNRLTTSNLPNSSGAGQNDGESNKRTLSHFLTKREKRVSLPALDASKSPSIKTPGKDMDFVVGLSENLLVECRRLQADNHEKSSQLKSLEDELNKLRSNNSSLLNKLNETSHNEEKYKDVNWELELKYQQLSQEFKVISENHNKAQKELAKQLDLSNEIRSELEEATLNKHTLEKEFSSTKVSVSQEIQTLKDHVDELNDVNSRLNDEIETLRQKFEEANAKPKEESMFNIPSLQPEPESDSDDEFNEPGVSPVKMIPTNNTALETEQLQSSLTSAHQTIAKLRQQILKLRSNELKSKQSPDQKSLPSLNTPVLRKPARGLNEPNNRNFHVLGNSNRSSKYTVEESELEDEWENFEGDSTVSFSQSNTPTKSKRRPISIASNELIDDTSDSELDDTANYQGAPLSSEMHIITPEEVETYAHEHNLVLLPIEEFESLKNKGSAPSSPFRNFKEADIVSKAKERGFNIFSQHEWSNQKSQLDSLNQEVKALNDRIVVISETEKKYAKEAADYREKLEKAKLDSQAESSKVKELESQLLNPSDDYIRESASKHDLEIVPATEHKNLKAELSTLKTLLANPSSAFITAKAATVGLKVLKNDDHSGLLAEIKSLKASIAESEKSTKGLNEQLAISLQSSEKAEDEKRELVSKLESLKTSSTQIENRMVELERSLKSAETEKEELASSKHQVEDEKLKLQGIIDSLTSDLDSHATAKEELHAKLKSLDDEVAQHQDSNKDLLSKFTAISSSHEHTLKEHSVTVDRLKAESEKQLLELTESSSAKLDELQKLIEEPSIAYIQEKAATKGFKTIEIAAYEKELNDLQAAASTLEYDLSAKNGELELLNSKVKTLEEELEAVNAESAKAIEKLESEIEEPTISYLEEKSSVKGFKVLELVVYEQELESLNNSITSLKEELEQSVNTFDKKADISAAVIISLKEKLALVTSERDELKSSVTSLEEKLESATGNITILRQELDHPAHEYLVEKASGQGFTVIPKLEHTSLLDKSSKTVHDLAEEEDFAVLKNSELRDLQERADKPTVEHLTVHAETHNHKVLPQSDYDKLVQKSNRTIDDHASEQNIVLLKQDEFKELKRKVDSPTIKEISEAAQSNVSNDEFSDLKENSSKTVEQLASEKDLTVVPTLDYQELLRKVDIPSVEEVASYAAKHEHALVPRSEFQWLKEQSSKSIEDHAKEQNVVLLSQNDHNELVRKSKKPSLKEIAALATGAGMIALSTKDHSSLVTKSSKSITELAKESNSVVVDQSEYNDLLSKIESPSIVYLKDKAKASDYKLLPSSDFASLTKKSEQTVEDLAAEKDLILLSKDKLNELKNPSNEVIFAKVDKLGFVALPSEEHEKLLAAAEAPSLEHLTEKAKLLGYHVLSNVEFSELVKTSTSPSKEFVEKNAAIHGLVAVSTSEYSQSRDELSTLMKNLADKDLLVEKVSSEGNVVLKQEAYNDLFEKANTPVEDLAASQNKVLLNKADHEELLSPSVDKITAHAEKLNLVVVPKEQHHELIREHQHPSIDHLKNKADSHGHVVVSKGHYESLQSNAEKPSVDHLTEKASLLGLSLLDQGKLKELETKASKTLEDWSKEEHKVLLSEDEFEELKHPDSGSVVKAASDVGLVALPKDQYETLTKSVDSPDLEYLEEKAKELSHVVVAKEDYENLKLIEEAPSAEFLHSKSTALNLSLIPLTELTQLKANAGKSLDDFALEQNKVVLSQDEYKSLKEPSKESLLAKVGGLGFITLAATEHQKLVKPSKKSLEKLASSENLVLVPKESYSELTQKSTRTVEDLAKDSNMKLLSNEEYEELQAPDSSRLIALATSAGLVAVPKQEYESLSHPSVELLTKNATENGLSIISKEELSELQSKSSRTIEDFAKEQHVVVLSKDEHESLLHPSKETVISYAAPLGLATLTQDEYKTLKNPTRDVLSVFAERDGLKIVEASKHEELLNPTRSFIEEHALKNDAVVLDKQEHESLLKPTKEKLEAHAEDIGLVLLGKDELESLKAPSKEHIEQLAKSRGLVAIEAEKLDQLETVSENPTQEFLSQKAEDLDLVLLPKDEFEAITEKANKTIEEVANENKSVVVSQEEYQALKSPPLEHLQTHAEASGHVIVPLEEVENLKNPSADVLSEKAKTLGFALLPTGRHEELLDVVENPSRDFIEKHALTHDLVTFETKDKKAFVDNYLEEKNFSSISKSDLESLKQGETLELPELSNRLELLGHVAVDSEKYKSLTAELTKDEILQLCEKNELKAVDTSDYERLLEPSKAEVIQKATSLGLIPIDKHEFEILKVRSELPEKDVVIKSCENYGLKAVEAEEFEKLKAPSEDEIIKFAEASGLVAVSSVAFSSLKSKAEDPDKEVIKEKGYILKDDLSYEEVEELAKRFHSKLVDATEINERSFTMNENRSVTTFASTINESEFTDALSRVDSNTSTIDGTRQSVTDNNAVAQLRTAASRFGFTLVTAGDLSDAPNLTNDEGDEDEEESDHSQYDTLIMKDTTIDEKDQISNRAADLGLVVLEQEVYDSLAQKDIDESELQSRAEELGLKVLNAEELEDLKNPQESQIREASERLGLVLITNEELNEVTQRAANVPLENFITPDNIKSIGEKNNLRVLTAEEYDEIQKESSSWNLEKLALGASILGVSVVGKEAVQRSSVSSDSVSLPLSKSEVVQKALEFDLVAVSKAELNDLREKAFRNRELDENSTTEEIDPPKLTKEELEASARNLGLLAIPENAFVATNISRIPDVNNVVVLPVTYYNKLTKSEVFNIDKVTNDELQAQISKRGLNITPGDYELKESQFTRNNTITSLTSSRSRKNLADAAENAASHEFDHPTSRSSRSSSRNPSISYSRTPSVKPMSRDYSIDGGISLLTNASLSEARIIPALTQTIIGEYLHKYYRRLGPLSSISETRHERYFWIHPYTLTLYWSTMNPVLGNPATHRTRAAAIIGVESVDDNNPLPAGLHHKSIIVHSQTRSIKFTCPTRQRHNIWYNSLRYLIQRSMDGIELDEDFDRLLERHKI